MTLTDAQYQNRKPAGKNKWSAQRRYWTRRTRLLAAARNQQRLLAQQQKMQATSSVSMVDVRLLFRKAEQCVSKASSKLQSLHISLTDKVNICLEKLPTDSTQDEAQITAAFGDVRIHTSSSEPYYWEQVYRRVAPEFPIPVDELGRARLFMPYDITTEPTQGAESNDNNREISKWMCNTDICQISQDMIDGTVSLLRQIASTNSLHGLSLYYDLNQCQNPNRTGSLGHPVNCQLDCSCSSLLRPARLLSCHFGVLSNIVRNVYELRRIAIAIRAVNMAKDTHQLLCDRLEGHGESATKSNNSSLLKKLDDAAKSFLYENFTIQPLNAEYPADAMIDYQLNKVSGQSANIFDTNLDLLTYPELFPTGVNGIKDTMREVKTGTSDYIKSRLLNKDAKFRLNIPYLFHRFQTQEVSNMCHSIGHILRSVTHNLGLVKINESLYSFVCCQVLSSVNLVLTYFFRQRPNVSAVDLLCYIWKL